MKRLLFFAAVALVLAACGNNKSEKGSQVQSSNGSKSGKITPPNLPNIDRHDCPAGTFFIEWEGTSTSKTYVALYGSDGRFLLRFAGFLYEWSGNAGIVHKLGEDENGRQVYKASFFSFKTLAVKPIGSNGTHFIKWGNFIMSKEGGLYRFWNLDGELVWEGNALRVDFENGREQDFWVLLSFPGGRPSVWLDLASGARLPHRFGETYPDLGDVEYGGEEFYGGD